MFIQFTKDKGLTFYNTDDERAAQRSKTRNDRYLHQEEATTPVLSMMPHPFASGHRQLYTSVSVKNDTPYEVNSIRVEYCVCSKDENSFIASGGTWTVGTSRGGCLLTEIHSTLILNDGTGRELDCIPYLSAGTTYAQFFIMLFDDVCCMRSSHQSPTECTLTYEQQQQLHGQFVQKLQKHKHGPQTFVAFLQSKIGTTGGTIVSTTHTYYKYPIKKFMLCRVGFNFIIYTMYYISTPISISLCMEDYCMRVVQILYFNIFKFILLYARSCTAKTWQRVRNNRIPLIFFNGMIRFVRRHI